MLLLGVRLGNHHSAELVIGGRFTALAVGAFALAWCPPARAAAAVPYQFVSTSVTSKLLTDFLGKPVAIRAEVVLPPSYDEHPDKKYPVIYRVPAFGEQYRMSRYTRNLWLDALDAARRDFLLVTLDPTQLGGHNEFADSANNGPWGTALTREIIPALEKQFRARGIPQARFLMGHSSGGWSVLWLEVNYPDEFAGAWATAPDPLDFRDFHGPDLTRLPSENFYKGASGRDYGFVRKGGVDTTTLRHYVEEEDQHPHGQFASFDAVFSPRGPNGKPARLFDHATGEIDSAVARYWEEHYDLARLVRSRWSEIGPKVRGKLHIVMGTQDTFHLDRSTQLFALELDALGAQADAQFAAGYDHFTLFDCCGGLAKRIVREMSLQYAAVEGK